MGLVINGEPVDSGPARPAEQNRELQRLINLGREERKKAPPTASPVKRLGIAEQHHRGKDAQDWESNGIVAPGDIAVERAGAKAMAEYARARKVFDWE